MSRNKYEFYPYINRSVCSVLDEMRKLDQTKNYGPLISLIEEVQSMVNRMEASLSDKKEVQDWTAVRQEMKKDMQQLEKEIRSLKQKKARLEKRGTKK